MSVRKIGRKARALERAKANMRWVDSEFQKRRDKEQKPGKREIKKQQVTEFVAQHPNVSTRIVERRFGMHRDTIANIREEIGFVVPKKDYRCYKAHHDNQWPKQPGERPGVCACGCGGKTTQTKNNNNKTGMKQGDFFRFIHGHQWLLRRRLLKPKGWRSGHDIFQERERLRVALVETAVKLPRYTETKVATFEDLRNRLKQIELNGHNVVDQQVARMVNIGRRCLTIGSQVPTIIHANVATKAEWLERLCSVSTSMGKAEVEFSELRKRFNEPMLVCNAAVARLLNRQRLNNPAIPFVSFTQRKETVRVDPISMHYPYGAEDDLLQFILSIIPDYYGDARGDIAQDMALAVISGECTRDDLKPRIRKFIIGYYQRFSAGYTHNMISLDAPVHIGSGDTVNLHELLSIKDSMTELNGGVNYETRGTWFDDQCEQRDGEIVARY